MISLHDVEQGSDAWLAMREELYTGSNADKLLTSQGKIRHENGVSRDYAKAGTSEFKGNFWTKRGHLLEDEAIGLYEQIEGVEVGRYGMITNSKYPGCGYSPDGVPPVKLVEVKCFDEEHHMQLVNAKRADDIPFKILAQIHFGLFISERPATDLIAYCPRIKDPLKAYRVITVKRSPKIIANFRRIISEV